MEIKKIIALFIKFRYKREEEKFIMKEKYKQNFLQLAYYKQRVSKNKMLRQTFPSIGENHQ